MTTTRTEDARRLQCVVMVLENDSVFCEKYKRNGTASGRRQQIRDFAVKLGTCEEDQATEADSIVVAGERFMSREYLRRYFDMRFEMAQALDESTDSCARRSRQFPFEFWLDKEQWPDQVRAGELQPQPPGAIHHAEDHHQDPDQWRRHRQEDRRRAVRRHRSGRGRNRQVRSHQRQAEGAASQDRRAACRHRGAGGPHGRQGLIMAALTKAQTEHAMLRLSQQKAAYIAKHTAHLGKCPEVDEPDEDEKRAMIVAGTAKLRPNISKFCYWQGAFDYPITPGQAAAEAAQAAWEAQYSEVKAKAEAIYQGVLDELIMSPDGKAVLERIAAAFA